MKKKIIQFNLIFILLFFLFNIDAIAYYWNFEAVNANYLYENNIDISSSTIAVIDSGYNSEHEDLQNVNIVSPYNFTDDNVNDLSDNHGHGTYVMGIIASAYNNEKGNDGLGFGAKVMPIKIYSKYITPKVSAVIKAIEYAVNNGADVINLSLGLEKDVPSLKNALYNAYQKGIIIVAAVGNDSKTELVYPAAYDFVVGVGSVNSNLEASEYSRYNESVFVTAPGEMIYTPSIIYPDRYAFVSGTSFAAPHVACLAAVAKSYKKSINCDDFMQILKNTSVDLGVEGYDIFYGNGLIDFKSFINNMSLLDINYDGFLDTTDLLLLKRVLINTYNIPNERTLYACDPDHDGRITVTDYLFFKRKMMQLI